ncbi:hypothetical protein ACI2JW_18090 [Serratia ureilytica]|uniref:hypothetical protein n=1 Tax=Serratia ureilytica TaxID=300181 RepID=UPI00384F21F9
MDKLREEFEEWFSKKYPLKRPSVRKLKLWEAWRDSRESVVVDVPDACAFSLCELVCRDDVIKAIRSIGLSIKGDRV